MQFPCPWCKHPNEASGYRESVKCTSCSRWMYSPPKDEEELPTCNRCGRRKHAAICPWCWPPA